MTIGQRIGELAKKKKMNIHQLAQLAGISYNTLYSIVRRKSDKVDNETVVKVASALGVSPFELSTGMTVLEYENQLEQEIQNFEAENREYLLAMFAMKNPRFIEALNSIGISIRLENDKRMYADWEDVTVELTMDDMEELSDSVWNSFLENIQRLWLIPVADKYQQQDKQT